MRSPGKIRIAHREHLKLPLELAKNRKMILDRTWPVFLEGWAAVVDLKHDLRAVYGSDLRAAWELLKQALGDELDKRVVEPCARGWYSLCWAWAWAVTWIALRVRRWRGVPLPMFWGRRDSPEPVRCECGWAGMTRWLVHDYQDDGSGQDVEPVDYCPRCGGDV